MNAPEPQMKNALKPLDLVATPLDGANVVEANAGTGKTWTITALYLRLLLETERSVEHILVVTFTEAATGELRDRIRQRLAQARTAFAHGSADADPVLGSLLERVKDREQALNKITVALRDFDQAPVHTIHGFCQRVLGDTAFECGMPFRTEILVDQSGLLQEIVEDFWRREMAKVSPLFARFIAGSEVNPDRLRDEMARYVGKPYLEVRRPEVPADVTELEREYERAFGEARRLWLGHRADIETQLVGNAALMGNRYRVDYVAKWIEQLDGCLREEIPTLDLCKQFDKFTPEALAAGTKSGHRTPKHAFYEACAALKRAHEALRPVYEKRIPALKARLLEYCNAELAARKACSQLQSYDDLLINLDQALSGESGVRLAEAVRARYSAALIDEFQDTDPVQYSIFEKIYRGSDLPVFLVGDPKQSIYSFRGADVFSYLRARHDAQRARTLEMNWRSERTLLSAVNALFENAPAPFVLPDIAFKPSHSAPGNRGQLVIQGESAAPFEIWWREAGPKPINKSDMKGEAASAAAAEIARLLSLGAREQARIVEDGREHRLRGGDIAVLVRNHEQAKAVRYALSAAGVASVQRGAENVFASREAEELERVLLAIAEPGREALIAGALATEMMGYSGTQLHALFENESRWDDLVSAFRESHRDWRERGFIPMLRQFLQRYRVMQRLLGYTDGERRVTNLLHLAELLHCEVDRRGMSGVLAWLAIKRRSTSRDNLEELLRLESDENLVKILTVHAAKGLEFPIVFCPFVWDSNVRSDDAKAKTLRFHDPDKSGVIVLDLGSDAFEQGRPRAVLEERSEDMRLLYVALTRAKYRCAIVWGRVNEAEHAAPAWLLHRAPTGAEVDLSDMRGDLGRIESVSDGTIRVRDLPFGANTSFEPSEMTSRALQARSFSGVLRDSYRVTSFTGLAHGRALEAPDYDAADRVEPMEAEEPARDIFAFPRGAQPGKCLHAIFEHVDFTSRDRRALEAIVARELRSHGFEATWMPVIADMVERVVSTGLDDDGTLRLERIARDKRLDELEFYYPLANLSHDGLRRVLVAAGFPGEVRERIGELTFAPLQGYMRGFIDLVFEHEGRWYLADYKSNWLGARLDAYHPLHLARVMGREAYHLQYLVYCVALHRYLSARVRGYDYDVHFGGVRYLFVRGMRPEARAARGVFSDRPQRAIIEALDRYFMTGQA